MRRNIEVFEFLRLFLEANDFKIVFFVVFKVISLIFPSRLSRNRILFCFMNLLLPGVSGSR